MIKSEYSTKELRQARELTVAEYAEIVGMTRQGVHYRLKNGKPLPNVKDVKQIGKNVVIVVV